MTPPTGKNPSGPDRIVKPPLPAKPAAQQADVMDLMDEARQLRSTPVFAQHGQSARTLVKHEHFRVVLIALKSGRHCQEHKAEESLSIQTVTGSVQVHFASDRESVGLPEGRVLALAPGVAHDFEAREDATLLLTLAWTGHHDQPTH
jgi:quercetin dioxygenase-like cupin family protein